jgi:hypothetical protein
MCWERIVFVILAPPCFLNRSSCWLRRCLVACWMLMKLSRFEKLRKPIIDANAITILST